MSVDEESTSCYCLMDSTSCHLLLDQPGSYALVGEPLTQAAVKRLKLAVFGSVESGPLIYSLRVYCVDDTPHAFQDRRTDGSHDTSSNSDAHEEHHCDDSL
ncbi:PREDICTED: netrin receptor UNC5D-like [Cyprinodon variegatus]|uniref:netrin receptor UNC5D-like n=1 Tax=Cyprinodon variegatus TaxID=28743 RepID=UPI000742830F|nr:PREDICTED: netrin receptor UNC5D-like [Cyprinodon variegatus]